MKDTLRIDDCYALPRQAFYLSTLRCFLIRNVRVFASVGPFFNLFVRYFLPSHTVALSFGQQLHYPFILETISRTVLRVQY